jgi:Flp pilus assembly secretin CpaC
VSGLLARGLTGAMFLGLAALSSGSALAQDMIDVTIDFAKVLRLDEQAATIVIGNPGIADATVEDETTLVLTGKAAGTTNLIVLNQDGKEMINTVVRVASNVQQLTTVFYGSTRQTFSCSPTCEQVILVGDDPSVFATATEQIQTRQQFATGQ